MDGYVTEPRVGCDPAGVALTCGYETHGRARGALSVLISSVLSPPGIFPLKSGAPGGWLMLAGSFHYPQADLGDPVADKGRQSSCPPGRLSKASLSY